MTNRFYLRPASAADAVALHELRMSIRAELFGGEAEVSSDSAGARELDELIKILVDPGPVGLWIAQEGDEIVGYSRADSLGAGFERMVALKWIALRSDARGKGYGSKLLKAALGDLPAFALAPSSDTPTALAGCAFLAKNEFVPAQTNLDGHDVDGFTTYIR